MDEGDRLAQRFEAHRTHLRAVAYRTLGSLSDADDAVQESWLQLSRSDISGVENLRGWLTTVVGRVCLDMLRWRTSRRGNRRGSTWPAVHRHGLHQAGKIVEIDVLAEPERLQPLELAVLDA